MTIVLTVISIAFLVGMVLLAIQNQKHKQTIRDLEYALRKETAEKEFAQQQQRAATGSLNSNREFHLRHRIETGNWRGF